MTLQEHTDRFADKAKEKVNNGKTFYKSTCDAWGSNKHKAMEVVAKAFRDKGYPVSKSVNHGVTDYRIYPKVKVKI